MSIVRRPRLPLAFAASALSLSSAFAGAWSPDSDPFVIGARYDSRLDLLPLAADLPEAARPWSGPYWADQDGSVAARWQTGESPWGTDRPTLAALRTMSPAEIAKLSPAEKIDVLRGRYDYPTVASVRAYAKPDAEPWVGACAGWSQSALNFAEPVATRRRNPEGIEVAFTAGDLKALAAYYYDFVAVDDRPEGYDDRSVAQIGRRCHDGDPRANCGRDVNPGALHIVLANRIAREDRGLIADFSQGTEIWQHPIYGYAARITGERAARADAAPAAVREVRVRLDLHYADYAEPSYAGTRAADRRLHYWLELDGEGRIVGGRYVSLFPGQLLDYVWISGPIAFGRGYETLNELLTPRNPGDLVSSPFTFPIELRSGG